MNGDETIASIILMLEQSQKRSSIVRYEDRKWNRHVDSSKAVTMARIGRRWRGVQARAPAEGAKRELRLFEDADGDSHCR